MTRGGHSQGGSSAAAAAALEFSCPPEPTRAGLFIVSVAHEAPRCLGPKLPTRFCPTNLLLRSRLPHPGPTTPGPPQWLSPTSWRCGWLPHAHSLHPWGPSKMCPSPHHLRGLARRRLCGRSLHLGPLLLCAPWAQPHSLTGRLLVLPSPVASSSCLQGNPKSLQPGAPEPQGQGPAHLRSAPLRWHSPALATQASSWFPQSLRTRLPSPCPSPQVSTAALPLPGLCPDIASSSLPWPHLQPQLCQTAHPGLLFTPSHLIFSKCVFLPEVTF